MKIQLALFFGIVSLSLSSNIFALRKALKNEAIQSVEPFMKAKPKEAKRKANKTQRRGGVNGGSLLTVTGPDEDDDFITINPTENPPKTNDKSNDKNRAD